MHKPFCSFHVVWILLHAILGRPPTQNVDHAVDCKYKRNARKMMSIQQHELCVATSCACTSRAIRGGARARGCLCACHLLGQHSSSQQMRCWACCHIVRVCECTRVYVYVCVLPSTLLHTSAVHQQTRQIVHARLRAQRNVSTRTGLSTPNPFTSSRHTDMSCETSHTHTRHHHHVQKHLSGPIAALDTSCSGNMATPTHTTRA